MIERYDGGRRGIPGPDTLDALEDAGMFDRIDGRDESETRFIINEDSDVYQAAKRFGTVLADNR